MFSNPAKALIAVLIVGTSSVFAQAVGFSTNYEAARDLAAQTGRPLLLHFYADYCPPCRRMEAQVFSDKNFKRQLSGMVVAVKINTAKRPDLVQKFEVNLIPHDRLLSPDGKEITRAGGFMSKASYLGTIKTGVDEYLATIPKKADATEPTAEENEPKQFESEAPGENILAANPSVTPKPSPLLSLDGYCPVELSTHRKWLKGAAQFSVEHKGLTYKLHSETNYKLFKANPEKYAPQMLGCDPVVLSTSHRALSGKTDFGAFFDGKLYLFQSQNSRTQFKQNPLRYVRIQHALDASRIDRPILR